MKKFIVIAIFLFSTATIRAQDREPTIFSEASPTLTFIGHVTAGNAYFHPGAKAAGLSITFEGPAGSGPNPRTTIVVGLKLETVATKFSNGQSENLRSGSATLNVGFKFRLGNK